MFLNDQKHLFGILHRLTGLLLRVIIYIWITIAFFFFKLRFKDSCVALQTAAASLCSLALSLGAFQTKLEMVPSISQRN